MPTPDWDRVRQIFEECIALPGEEREAFLERACEGNDDLLNEARRLLKGDELAKSEFMDWPDGSASPDQEPQSQHNDAEAGGIASPVTRSAGPLATSQTRHIGPYKLLEEIGHGGMGEVWLAQQTEPVSRRVAIKLIKSQLTGRSEIARFEAERQALALMNHPNIAKVFDAGTTDDGMPYYVMEYINGIPITEFCDKQKLSIRDRLQVFIPICRAVQHAHQKGIIHRDLKPSNVLVAKSEGFPVPKVIDFGLAKATDHQRMLTDKTLFTEIGKVVGTLQYMSPEQAALNSNDIDSRTDIYSLGIILYELLTGMTPLDRQTIKDQAILKVLEIIRQNDTPRPSYRLSSSGETITTVSERRQIEPGKLQSILRGELDWVVMKALEKDRNRRYESAASFAEDIHRFLIDEPVTARPPSSAYRIRKFVARNKMLVGSAAIISILLVAGLIGLFVAWQQSLRATKLATENEHQAIEFVKSTDDLTDSLASQLLGNAYYNRGLAPSNDPINHSRNSQAILETSFGLYLRRAGAAPAEQRKWFFQSVDSFEKLESEGELEPRSMINYATALDNAAQAARDGGDNRHAIELHKKRMDILGQMLENGHEGQDKVYLELARSHLHLGLIENSLENNNKAIEYLQSLPNPTSQSDLLLANCLANRGKNREDRRDAETDTLRAIELFEKRGDLDKLMQSYDFLSELERDLNKPELEQAYREKALALASRVQGDSSASYKNIKSGAERFFNAGLDMHRKNKLADALTQYNQAIELLEPLAAKSDRIKSTSVFIQSYWHRAQALVELGQMEEAIDDWKTAISAGPSSKRFKGFVPYFEAQLLRCRAENDPVAVAASLEFVTRDVENKGEVLMVIASVYSLASEAEEDDERKQRWLAKAIEAISVVKSSGKLSPPLLLSLKMDPEFQEVRNSAEFKEILNGE